MLCRSVRADLSCFVTLDLKKKFKKKGRNFDGGDGGGCP